MAPNAASESSRLVMLPPASSVVARAVLQALCLIHDGFGRDSTARIRLLSIHLNDRQTLRSSSPPQRQSLIESIRFSSQSDRSIRSDRSVGPSNRAAKVLDSNREVTTCSGKQHEEERHRQALSSLVRDGVVRFDRHCAPLRTSAHHPAHPSPWRGIAFMI